MDNKLINENRVCHPHPRVNPFSLSIEPSFTAAVGYNSLVHRVWRVTHKRLLAVTSNE